MAVALAFDGSYATLGALDEVHLVRPRRLAPLNLHVLDLRIRNLSTETCLTQIVVRPLLALVTESADRTHLALGTLHPFVQPRLPDVLSIRHAAAPALS